MFANQVKMARRRHHYSLGVLSSVTSEYIANTTIHGLGYLGAKDKHLVEKLWWLIVFLFSLVSCSYLISETWLQWEESPVIVTISPMQTAVWEIPFPAVTICPINRVNQSAYSYKQAVQESHDENSTGVSRLKFHVVSLICGTAATNVERHNITDVYLYNTIIPVVSKLEQTIFYALWRNNPWKSNVTNLFTPLLTEEGMCFTFNALNEDDMYTGRVYKHNSLVSGHNRRNQGWNIEDGYPNTLTMNTYPERTSQAGINAGLQLLLRFNPSEREMYCATAELSGFKVFVHNPAESPRMNQQFVLLPFTKHVGLSVKPNMVTTSADLKSAPPRTKNCYFSNEKQLAFFSVYTQNNCRIECTANVTLKLCGCVPFYFPHDNNTGLCGLPQTQCLSDAKAIIFNYENENAEHADTNHKWKAILEKCNCRPSCTVLEYAAESTQTDLIVEKTDDHIEWAKLDIYFKETYFQTIQRNELFGQVDFLANCGGLLGLFMGFSVLSLLEIVYFLTIRVFYKIKKDKLESLNISSKLFTTQITKDKHPYDHT